MVDIRAERERAGLSQARLAALAGIAQSNLSAYERGSRTASPAMIERIRRAMVRPSERLRAHRDEVAAIIERHGGQNPRVIGSVARGEDTPSSDLDIVVTVRPGYALRFASTARELEDLLGVHVDVVSEGGLKRKHERILAEAVPL
jgi:predicted nucleotidyltransferase